jgi:hypothetical protein
MPHDAVAEVIHRVLFESHGSQDPEHARGRPETAHRYVEGICSDTVETIPADETAAKIRRIVSR